MIPVDHNNNIRPMRHEDKKLEQPDGSDSRKSVSYVAKYGCIVITMAMAIGSALFHHRMQRMSEDSAGKESQVHLSVTTIARESSARLSVRLSVFLINWVFLWTFSFLNVQTLINLWNHLLQKMDETRKDLVINLKLLGLLGFMFGNLGSSILFNVSSFWKRECQDPSLYCYKVHHTTYSESCGSLDYILSPVPITLTVIIGISYAMMIILDMVTGNVRFFKLSTSLRDISAIEL